MADFIVSCFLILGGVFALLGSYGLVKLPDFYTRLHAPTKATTLGVGGLLIASVVYFSTRGEGLHLEELLITVFLIITAPVSAHLLGRAARNLRIPGVQDPRKGR
jgi:multicomponent K+:H+ antiporter subunit G